MTLAMGFIHTLQSTFLRHKTQSIPSLTLSLTFEMNIITYEIRQVSCASEVEIFKLLHADKDFSD